jgi:hypothetical protein
MCICVASHAFAGKRVNGLHFGRGQHVPSTKLPENANACTTYHMQSIACHVLVMNPCRISPACGGMMTLAKPQQQVKHDFLVAPIIMQLTVQCTATWAIPCSVMMDGHVSPKPNVFLQVHRNTGGHVSQQHNPHDGQRIHVCIHTILMGCLHVAAILAPTQTCPRADGFVLWQITYVTIGVCVCVTFDTPGCVGITSSVI